MTAYLALNRFKSNDMERKMTLYSCVIVHQNLNNREMCRNTFRFIHLTRQWKKKKRNIYDLQFEMNELMNLIPQRREYKWIMMDWNGFVCFFREFRHFSKNICLAFVKKYLSKADNKTASSQWMRVKRKLNSLWYR